MKGKGTGEDGAILPYGYHPGVGEFSQEPMVGIIIPYKQKISFKSGLDHNQSDFSDIPS